MNRTRLSYLAIPLVMALLVCAAMIGSPAHRADAVVSGNPNSPDRLVLAANDGSAKRIVYFTAGVKTPAANTPVASNPTCGLGGYSLFSAQVILTGTMSGTNPTLAVKWQHSIDGGTNWIDVGTWTTINATVTPASQVQTVGDIHNNSTAVAYGDCFRAVYTMGGTSPGANISIMGIAKP